MHRKNKDLQQDRLKELLRYDPYDGNFYRLVKTANSVNIGDIAGGLTLNGYVTICVDSSTHTGHRLAWFYMTGEWPSCDIDHINRIRTDNLWENLRLANRSQNSANSSLRSDNTSGYRGVSWNQDCEKWAVMFHGGNKPKYIGVFRDKEEAARAYDIEAIKCYGEFAHTNFPREEYANG